MVFKYDVLNGPGHQTFVNLGMMKWIVYQIRQKIYCLGESSEISSRALNCGAEPMPIIMVHTGSPYLESSQNRNPSFCLDGCDVLRQHRRLKKRV